MGSLRSSRVPPHRSSRAGQQAGEVEDLVTYKIAQAYADSFFDFIEPLRADHNYRHLVERNEYLQSRIDSRLEDLRQAIACEDQGVVINAAKELFDSLGLIGDVRTMRACYRALMQARCGDLELAAKEVGKLEWEYQRLREEILGFQLH